MNANILNDAEFAAAFMRIDDEMIPGRDDMAESGLVTIPAPIDPARDPGVVDVTPDTIAPRKTVSDIRDFLKKRDRNAPNRRGGTDPEAA